MAQFGDFIARLFGGGTRGLSGDAERVLPDDPELEYFNARLRRHQAGEDLVDDPQVIWDGGEQGGRHGLQAHLLASEYGEGLGFTDVLVVLSTEDWHRALQHLREPWPQRAAQVVGERLWWHCEQHDLHQVFPQRPFGFRFIEDGGHEMAGARIGLSRGEFVTGLLPNLYTGTVRGSKPVIAILVNIPGAWEGYQEVGRLHNDQVQFTLGTHWLDNFRHEGLRAPALYRLQQYADGSFVHIVNPDGPARYRISSQELADGPAVLTLSGPGGEAIAHMVLAIVEEPSAQTIMETAPSRIQLPSPGPASEAPARTAPAPAESPAPPAPPAAGPDLFAISTRTIQHGGNRTVIPADLDERMLTLRERGALFQKVHFARFMVGYDVYLGRGGELGTTIRDRAATFEIRGRSLALVPHIDGVVVDGRIVRRGERLPLEGDRVIEVAGQRLEFRDLRSVEAEGWPYLGEVRRTGGASHMVFGGTYKLGRDRRCKVRLPDEPSNENIVWMPELAQGGTIRSRNGEIPKSRFYTDSIMVASEHAEIGLDGEPVLRSQARHCFTYVRRGKQVLALQPAQGPQGAQDLRLQARDEILIGNCVFEVDYPPADGPVPSASGPEQAAPRISADELARAAVSLDESSPRQGSGPPSGADMPAAAGLGEAGAAPRGLSLPKAGPDSFMGIDPAEPDMATRPMDRPTPPPPAPARPAPRPSSIEASFSPADVPDPARVPPPINVRTYDGEPGGEGPFPRGPRAPLPPPAPAPPSTTDEGAPAVSVVDEDQWQLELSRPMVIRVVGWMVSGELTIGNHEGAEVVIPENRSDERQRFQAVDYFRVFVRARRGRIELLASDEATLRCKGEDQAFVEDLPLARMEVLRRAPDGQEDFRVLLEFLDQPLPDPRARMLAMLDGDPMARALFTQGLPLRQQRRLRLGPIECTAWFDGSAVTLSNYLDSYRLGEQGFRPFFVQRAEGSWSTVPEDGGAFTLSPGDRLLVDGAVYRVG